MAMTSALPVDDPGASKDLQRFLHLRREGTAGAYTYAALLGLRSYDLPYLLKCVQQGLSFSTLEHLRRSLGMSWEDLGQLLAIPSRTLTRRKSEGRFQPDESDRILRATRLYAKALELFEGDPQSASRWLSSSQLALGGLTPLDLARSELGAREVESLLDRLEQGVFV